MRCEAGIETVSKDNAGEHEIPARARQSANFVIFSKMVWSTR